MVQNTNLNLNKPICIMDDWSKTNKNCCRSYHNPKCNIFDIVKDYYSYSITNYSDWIDCCNLNKYYYFIKNLGIIDVVAYIEISPDKNLVYRDSDEIIIKSLQVSYLQPLRESRYIRFSYNNLNSTSTNLITSWFQAKL